MIFAGRVSAPPQSYYTCEGCGTSRWENDAKPTQQQQQIQPDKDKE